MIAAPRGLRAAARHLAIASAIGLLCLGVSACTAQDDTSEDSVNAAAPSADPAASEPDGLQDTVGVRNALTSLTCKPREGRWSATGVLTNNADEAMTFVVEVSVFDRETGEVLGQAKQQLPLSPGAKERVTYKNIHRGDTSAAACSARVVAGDA